MPLKSLRFRSPRVRDRIILIAFLSLASTEPESRLSACLPKAYLCPYRIRAVRLEALSYPARLTAGAARGPSSTPSYPPDADRAAPLVVIRARARARVCACVCVWIKRHLSVSERARERGREGGREREREREKRERERKREREKERIRKSSATPTLRESTGRICARLPVFLAPIPPSVSRKRERVCGFRFRPNIPLCLGFRVS